MGTQVKFDYSLTNGIVSEDEIKSMAKIEIGRAHV